VLDEGEIRALHAAGRFREAATRAIQLLSPQIHRYLSGVLRNPDDADDALSAWSENLWKGMPGFRWESSLRVWAYRLAWNTALNLRDQAWRRRGRRLRTTEASVLAAEARRSSMMLRDARAEKIDRLRASLDPDEQSLLTLRLDQELSWAEISEVLTRPAEEPLSEPSLRQRYHRIKEKMGKRLKEEGLL